jgi:hypothetical protein
MYANKVTHYMSVCLPCGRRKLQASHTKHKCECGEFQKVHVIFIAEEESHDTDDRTEKLARRRRRAYDRRVR